MTRILPLLGFLSAALVNAAEPEKDVHGEPLPPHATARLGSTAMRHGGPVVAVAFSPDGKQIATGGDHTGVALQLWDIEKGHEVRPFSNRLTPIRGFAFSPNGNLLAYAGGSSQIIVADVKTGNARTSSGFPNTWLFSRLIFHPGGDQLIGLAPDRLVELNFTDNGRGGLANFRIQFHQIVVTALCFAPDGKSVARAVDDRIELCASPNAAPTHTLKGHKGDVADVAFLPKGDEVVSAGADGTVRFWDAATGKELRQAKDVAGELTRIAIGPAGEFVAVGSKAGDVFLIETKTGTLLKKLRAHGRSVLDLDISANGELLVTCGADHSARVWNVKTGKSLFERPGHAGDVGRVAFSDDGQRVFSAGMDRTVRTWDTSTGEQLKSIDTNLARGTSSAFAPRSGRSATGGDDGVIRLFGRDGEEVRRLTGHAGEIGYLDFSPSENVLASSGIDKTVRLWDITTGRELTTLRGHTGEVVCTAFSANGDQLVSTSADKTIRLWDVSTGRTIRTFIGHGDIVKAAALSPDGRHMASGGKDKTLRLWDIATSEQVHEFAGVKQEVHTLTFTADGKSLIVGTGDNKVELWELVTRQPRLTLTGHRGSVVSLDLSLDGKALVTGSADGTAICWDLTDVTAQTQAPPTPLWHWNRLTGTEPRSAFEAVNQLAEGPTIALELLTEYVKPAEGIEPDRLAGLVEDLSSANFRKRERATVELTKLGDIPLEALRKAIVSDPGIEAKRRIEMLLRRLDKPTPERVLAVRSVEVLERIATPEAHELLKQYAAGSTQARLTREAQAALDRLSRRVSPSEDKSE